MVALMAVMLGCVLDFSHLSDETRLYTIIAITVICGIYIVIRSAEKAMAKGWSFGLKRLRVEKGELKAELETKGGSDAGSANSEDA